MSSSEQAAKESLKPLAIEVENLKPIERLSWGVRARLSAVVMTAILLISGVTGQFLIEVQRRTMFEEARQRAAALLETLSVPCAMAMSTNDLERLDAYLEELSEGGGRRLDLLEVAMSVPQRSPETDGMETVRRVEPASERSRIHRGESDSDA